jgi:sulfatase maturation enzyme AslB (radical SAM superfamily)
MTNDFGQYFFASPKEFGDIISKKVCVDSELGEKLKEKNMIYDESDFEYSSINKYGMRDLKYHVNVSTALHIFVVTTACNLNCIYCQANSGKDFKPLFMNEEVAKKAVDIALQSPTKNLDFEFQGGEPLLNFEIIKYIVEYTESKKEDRCKTRVLRRSSLFIFKLRRIFSSG